RRAGHLAAALSRGIDRRSGPRGDQSDRGAARLRAEFQGHHLGRPDARRDGVAAMIRLGLLLILLASAAPAETVVAARNIPARSLIGPGDLLLTGAETSGALTDPAAA